MYLDSKRPSTPTTPMGPPAGRCLMLELAILGLLEDQELHGYEIRKRLRDELGLFSNISFGSLYPALSRLERGGAVAGPSKRAVTMRPAGSR